MKLFKVLIVEDEPHAQTNLLGLLTHFPDLKVCGQAYSIDEAEALVKSCEPDLLFCDVDLPPGNSLDWLSGYGSLPFDVIFTTSYDTYAIQAFRLSAVDYLLKPLDRGQLDVAVQRFRQRHSQQDPRENLAQLLSNLQQPQNLKKIALPTLSGFTFMTIDQIVRCESDNTYTTFYTADRKKMVVSRTLKECEQLLLEHGFFRIHNSHLINLHYIKEYIKGDGGQVKMDDGSVVDVSRRRKDEFLKWFR